MSAGQSISWAPLTPVLVLVGGLVLILLADLVLPLRLRRMVLPAISALACLGAAAGAAWGDTATRGTFCSPAGSGQAVRCAYVLGETAVFLTVLLCLAAAAVLVLALAQLRADRAGVTPAGEYCLVLLAATIGAVIVAGSRDLITLVVGLETLTVPLYAAVAFRRGCTAGIEAALTLLVVSVTSTALMLLGIGFLYGLTGTMHLDALAVALAAGGGVGDLALSGVAVVLLLAGLAFKVGAVPFHVWAPSTYQGAPIPVAAYLSSVSKAGGIAGLIAVLPAVSAGAPAAASWIALLAAVSMTVGNLVAMRQQHLVRLLAWSGIAQTGYLLVGLAVLSGRSDQAVTGAGATLAYLAVYVLMTVGSFACIAAITGSTGTDNAARDGPSIESIRGLAGDHPRIAAAFALFLIGLAGLPPALLGLFGKVVVVRAAFTGDAGWLGILVAINTVVAFVYYVRVAAALFARTAGPGRTESPIVAQARPGPSVSTATGVLVAVLAALALAAGFWPDLIIGAAPLLAPSEG
jgi:NADH-quinone oxidoreductase subunit N